MSQTRTYVGLDIGTTKISAIIAEVDPQTQDVRIVGVGISPSEGLRRGVVVNLEKTVASIARAVEEAERMAGVQVKGVYAGIAGDHIRSINSRGVIAVSRKDNEISQADVDRVVDAAKAVAIPMDREIIHVIPQEFIVDDQDGIKDPIGMSGVRLEAEVHIITGAVTSAKNICKSITRAGLKVHGVVLLDIGGGTTDVAVFFEGSIRHTAIVPLGGASVTNDIAIGLRTPIEQAERIKIEHGMALASLVQSHERLSVPGVGGRADKEISRLRLAEMIEPRVEEIFTLAGKEVRKNHFADLLGAGVVLTGGSSLLPGAVELAEQIFEMPVRRGIPSGLSGLMENVRDPRYATGVGLILHAVHNDGGEALHAPARPGLPVPEGLRRFFAELF
jgi:cell division protein FtsA